MDPRSTSPDEINALLLDDDEMHLLEAIDPRLLDYGQRNLHVTSPKVNDTPIDYHPIHPPLTPPKTMDSLLLDDKMHPLVASPKLAVAPLPPKSCVSYGPRYSPTSNALAQLNLPTIRHCIREFVSSINLSPSSRSNMSLSPINLRCFRALKSELNKPEFLSSKEVDSFRYLILRIPVKHKN